MHGALNDSHVTIVPGSDLAEQVQPQQRQPKRLARSIVQVGADPPQRLLVESRGPPGGVAQAFMQPRVLIQ